MAMSSFFKHLHIKQNQCNQVRRNLSLIKGIELIQRRRAKLGDNFLSWVNQSVPNRFHLNNKKHKKPSINKEYCEDFQI